eukprot:766766-Hanusia_phi.AAC.1
MQIAPSAKVSCPEDQEGPGGRMAIGLCCYALVWLELKQGTVDELWKDANFRLREKEKSHSGDNKNAFLSCPVLSRLA